MKTAAVIALLGLVAAGCWWFYQAGISQCENRYNDLKIQLQAESEKSKLRLEAAENEAKHYIEKSAEAEARIRRLRTLVKSGSGGGAGGSCPVADSRDIDGLLLEAAADSRLQKDASTGSFVNGTEATQANRDEYSIYTIGEYNSCAAQVNALIESVK